MPMIPTEQPPFDERIEALLEQGRAHLDAERFEEAIGSYEEAERLALGLSNPRAEQRAFVSRCAVLMAMERGLQAEPLARLREILMGGDDAVTSWLTAYTIARAYEFAKEHRKGLFYARIALDRARLLASAEREASSRNQVGNFLLAESRFREAQTEYERALALLGPEPSLRKALILTNLGYARVVLGLQDTHSLLYRSLRMVCALGARRERIFPHLDLCFALLETGRLRHALRHGTKALALAEEAGEHDSVKHALFLLGEAAQQSGDPEAARELFERLQRRYFPEASYLTDVLMAVDVRKLINLKA